MRLFLNCTGFFRILHGVGGMIEHALQQPISRCWPDGARDGATAVAERSYSRYASVIAQERARRAFIFQSDDRPAQPAAAGQGA
jgi:hypothetical protein